MKLLALRIEQAGKVMYSTTFTAGMLEEVEQLTKADAWSPTNRDGYQRSAIETRFRKIAKHVVGADGQRGLLPGAILLNSRRALKFKPLSADHPNLGWLELSDDVLPLWEVDGQHRLGGLRVFIQQHPEFADYEFPVIILDNVPRIEEAVLFFVINTQQKRVPTDLAQRLVAQQADDPQLRSQVVGEGKLWIKTGTEVVDMINDNNTPGSNPWYARIGIPGVRNPGVILRQVSFVQSMKPILDAESVYASLQPERIAKLLIMYWEALVEVYPAAFASHEHYVIQTTVGVFPLHSIAVRVFELVRTKHGKISKEGLVEVLSVMAAKLQEQHQNDDVSEDPSSYWLSDGGEAGKYAGAKGFRIIADQLREALDHVQEESGAELVLVD